MSEKIVRLASIVRAKLFKRPIALCDIGDLDGITCATLFKMKHPDGEVVLAAPYEVRRSWLLKAVTWDFVADLPCPGKALVRADHHASNPPCAVQEFYDPFAPAAAVLALKALGLDERASAVKLVQLAVETDTAKITSPEALALNDAVKGSKYRGKLRLIDLLASEPLEEVLSDERVRESIERYRSVREATEKLAAELPLLELFVAVFKGNQRLSYRYLCILMESRGARLTAVIVPKGFSLRIYLGSATKELDVSKLALKLGGGGHPYAAGATIKAFRKSKAISKVLSELRSFTGRESLDVVLVSNGKIELQRWP